MSRYTVEIFPPKSYFSKYICKILGDVFFFFFWLTLSLATTNKLNSQFDKETSDEAVVKNEHSYHS